MSIQTQLAIAQMHADHYQRTSEMQTRMLAEFSELTWRIILELNLPPEPEPKPPILFGFWSIEAVLAAIVDLKARLVEAEGQRDAALTLREGADARAEEPYAAVTRTLRDALSRTVWEAPDPTEGHDVQAPPPQR